MQLPDHKNKKIEVEHAYFFKLLNAYAEFKDIQNTPEATYENLDKIKGNIYKHYKLIKDLPLDKQKKLIQNITPLLGKLWKLRSEFEYEYEKITSERIIDNKINTNIQSYIGLYSSISIEVTRIISENFGSLLGKKCIFIGSGPLPLSIISLSINNPNLRCDLLDKDQVAQKISKNIILKYNMQDRIHVLPAQDVKDFEHLDNYDLIFTAALLGITYKEKIDIYSLIGNKISFGKKIIARTSNPNRANSIIYTPIPLEKIDDLYSINPIENIDPRTVMQTIILTKK